MLKKVTIFFFFLLFQYTTYSNKETYSNEEVKNIHLKDKCDFFKCLTTYEALIKVLTVINNTNLQQDLIVGGNAEIQGTLTVGGVSINEIMKLSGPPGATGAQGPKGDKGDTGDIGPAGEVGAQGPKGDTGDTGLQGPQGVTGSQGLQGLKGDAGDIGLQGPKGDKGDTGDIGPAGEVGAQGPKGDTGDTGLQGPQGVTGSQGLQGLKGDIGDIGPAGEVGPIGATGAQGPKGDTGATGASGIVNYASFYALMPSDNASSISVGGAVSFPQTGPANGAVIVRASSSTFTLKNIGTYEVFFQVYVGVAGQLVMGLDSGSGVVELSQTVVGSKNLTDQLVGSFFITTTVANSVLSIRNPSVAGGPLSILTNVGAALLTTSPVSASLTIKQLS